MESTPQQQPALRSAGDAPATRFTLDVPAERPPAPGFRIAGWVAGALPLRAARLKDRPATALALVSRPDVAKAFPDCPHTGGFQGIGPRVPQDGQLAIEFLLGDAWVSHTFPLQEPLAPTASEGTVDRGPQRGKDDPDVTYEVPSDPQARNAPDGAPYPPLDLCLRIGSPTYDSFWNVGADARRTIVRALPLDWTFTGKRVLDFGCGVGRVIRHFAPDARNAEFWGCDIDLPSVMWMNRHFSPPFRFQNGADPALPLEANSFDLVYATSVFSHLNANWNPWLADLRRILKPGGYAFLTFLHRVPYEVAYGVPFPKERIGMLVKHPGQPWECGGPSVFISPEWLLENWGGLFDVEFIALEGLHGFQSIAMLRKPALHARPRGLAPVIRSLGSYGAINPHAKAQITIPDLPDRRLIDGRGLRGHGTVRVAGWAAFRGGELAGIRFLVDGNALALAGRDAIRHEEVVPDFEDAPYGWFNHELDISSLAPGEHTLRLEFRGMRGESHWAEVQLMIER